MQYETERLILRTLSEDEAPLLADYFLRNSDYLEQWEPKREESFFSVDRIRDMIAKENGDMSEKRALSLYIFKKGEERIIGNAKLNNIIYGIFYSCYAGYRLDKDEHSKGYMTEALGEVVRIAFDEYGLHRIEANIMPRNKASRKVVTKLGFKKEGRAIKYLKINGKWEDHIHYVLLNEAAEYAHSRSMTL